MWISALPEAPEPCLDGYGWSATAVDARDKLRDYGRSAPPRGEGAEPTWLIDAVRAYSRSSRCAVGLPGSAV